MAKLPPYEVGPALLWAVLLLIGWRPLVDTFALSLRDDAYTYILLIFPISATLIFLEWRSVRTLSTLGIRAGSALLAVAVFLACSTLLWSASLPSDVQLSIRMLALVLSWTGAFVLCFGSRTSKQVLFPLSFLFGLVPLPHIVLNGIINFLQLGSAWAAHLIFAVFGVPVAQDGVLLTIPGLAIQVASECSSIRSSSMLLVTAIVLAQLLLRSPWRKAVVISLAVPLSVAKNGLRIFVIAMLGTRVDPGYLTGRFHHQGGFVFFAVALIAIFTLLWILRRREDLSPISELNTVKAVTTGG
jgi:exosortase